MRLLKGLLVCPEGVPGRPFWTSSLAVVNMGISMTALYKALTPTPVPAALRLTSCHGETTPPPLPVSASSHSVLPYSPLVLVLGATAGSTFGFDHGIHRLLSAFW